MKCHLCTYERYRESILASYREKYKNDPEYRKRKKAANKQRLNTDGNLRVWLARALHQVKDHAKRQRWRNGMPPRAVTITLQSLHDLWTKQAGLCALTGVQMQPVKNSPWSISVDRIDSAGEYTPNNIQLVCRAMNLAKSTWSQVTIAEFIAAIRSVNNR